MRATTIRLPNDLWERLEREARKEGISVAQYVRDAALYAWRTPQVRRAPCASVAREAPRQSQ
jgi:predicted DNA-binding ribbon-helix-helix protein